MNEFAIKAMRSKFERLEALDEPMHNKMMDLFRKFLLVGGLPDAVNSYLSEKNIQSVREIQKEIHDYYAADASKYDEERKLMIRRIYDLIPSFMESKKKRVVAQAIENKRGKTFNHYSDEFEYLISAGIALNVQAIATPVFPLIESSGKNLLKLYLNDVGILTGILYGNNIRAILDDQKQRSFLAIFSSKSCAFSFFAHTLHYILSSILYQICSMPSTTFRLSFLYTPTHLCTFYIPDTFGSYLLQRTKIPERIAPGFCVVIVLA